MAFSLNTMIESVKTNVLRTKPSRYVLRFEVGSQRIIKIESDLLELFYYSPTIQKSRFLSICREFVDKNKPDLLRKLEVLFGQSQRVHFRFVLCMMYAGLLCVMARG